MGRLDNVHRASAQSLNLVDTVAVALLVTENGFHAGMLTRAQPGHPLFFTHLCAYNHLLHDHAAPGDCHIWVSLNIDPYDAELVVASCRLTVKKRGRNKFPYSFSSPKGFFDENMEHEEGPDKTGLTCATFVLGVFNAARVDLVRYNSWPIRPGDLDWRNYVMPLVRMPPDLICKVQNGEVEVSPRYHPLEVAGAAAIGRYPVRFRTARKYARHIYEMLHQHHII